MGVPGDQDILVLFTRVLEGPEQALHLTDRLFDPRPGIELQVYQYLVVSGTPCVYFLAYVAELAGQHKFHLGMDILDVVLYGELSFFRQ